MDIPGSKQLRTWEATEEICVRTHTHTHIPLPASFFPLSLNGRDAGHRGSRSRAFGDIQQDLFHRKRKKTLLLLLALLGDCSLDASGFVHYQLLTQITDLF